MADVSGLFRGQTQRRPGLKADSKRSRTPSKAGVKLRQCCSSPALRHAEDHDVKMRNRGFKTRNQKLKSRNDEGSNWEISGSN
jgi:hypothetical protein